MKIFPTLYNGEVQPLVKWKNEATDDDEVIKEWKKRFGRNKTFHFRVAVKESGLTVIDIDTKKGKTGMEELRELENKNAPLPETLTVRTPSGGLHLFYSGVVDIYTTGSLSPAIDTPLVVPVPGENVPGKGEYKIEANKPIASLPLWVYDKLRKKQIKSESAPYIIKGDGDHNLRRVIEYLKNADVATEGENGDAMTYKIAATVRDYGVESDKCIDLMLEYWNYRCEPPWEVEELRIKINNAYAYARNSIGSLTPESEFTVIENFVPPPTATPALPPRKSKKQKGMRLISAKEALSSDFKTDWLIKGILAADTMSLFYGAPSSLKSFLLIDMAMHVASGIDWRGCRTTQGHVVYLAGEGINGIKRRLKAWYTENGIQEDRDIPFYFSSCPVDLLDEKSAREVCDKITDMAIMHGFPRLVVIDTLNKAFGSGDENSTKDMTTFINNTQDLRDTLGCAVAYVHHIGHKDKDRARGSSALQAGVDTAYRIEYDQEIKGDDLGLVKMIAVKVKDGRRPDVIASKPAEIILGVDEDLDNITSLVMRPTEDYTRSKASSRLGSAEREVLNVIRATISVQGSAEKESIQKAALYNGVPRGSIWRAIQNLIDKEIITLSNDGVISIV